MEHELARAQRLESIGQLAGGIAHEINTPNQYIGDNACFLQEAFGDLQGVIDALRRLMRSARDGVAGGQLQTRMEAALRDADLAYLEQEIPRAIAELREGVEHVARIVRAMKDFSSAETREKTPTDVNRAIESTLMVCRNEWRYVAEAVTDLDPDLPLVSCVPGELNEVILNLVLNAVQAIREAPTCGAAARGTITVRTRRLAAGVEIRVEDTGTGISETIRDRIFDPFFTTKDVGKGTGQGLAIAHAIVVKNHGGTIVFETEPGRGTRFVVRLPLQLDTPLSRPTFGRCPERAGGEGVEKTRTQGGLFCGGQPSP
jgi:signal transduction histidine kinase